MITRPKPKHERLRVAVLRDNEVTERKTLSDGGPRAKILVRCHLSVRPQVREKHAWKPSRPRPLAAMMAGRARARC